MHKDFMGCPRIIVVEEEKNEQTGPYIEHYFIFINLAQCHLYMHDYKKQTWLNDRNKTSGGIARGRPE